MLLPTNGLTIAAPLVRRALLTALTPLLVVLTACERGPAAGTLNGAARPVVVLYTSMDDALARPLLERFERETGVKVEFIGDTEATKTTGLVLRLAAEKARPRCDVWWSSEALGTIALARQGVLSGPVFSLAQRPRVVVCSTSRLGGPGQPARPASVMDLVKPEYRGRIGMARPAFGTTRGHMAALRLVLGKAGFEAWLVALKANGVRLYDGNARVVRAIADGEIDVGLTDSDDAAAAVRNGWAVAAVPDALHPVRTPITLARVRTRTPGDAADRLIAFLRSPDVLRALVEGETAAEPMPTGGGKWGGTDWDAAADLVEEALASCASTLGA